MFVTRLLFTHTDALLTCRATPPVASPVRQVGRESFTANFLPWLLAVLWGALALWLPALGLRALSTLAGEDDGNVRAAAGIKVGRNVKSRALQTRVRASVFQRHTTR